MADEKGDNGVASVLDAFAQDMGGEVVEPAEPGGVQTVEAPVLDETQPPAAEAPPAPPAADTKPPEPPPAAAAKPSAKKASTKKKPAAKKKAAAPAKKPSGGVGTGGDDSPPAVPDVSATDAPTIPTAAIVEVDETNTREDPKGRLPYEMLRDSIVANGIQQPLMVRNKTKDTYILVAGRRRLEVAKEIGMQYVPINTQKADALNKECMSATENLVREDLNPIEEAKAYRILMTTHKKSQAQLAKIFGITPARMSQKLALLKAPVAEQKKLIAGEISEADLRKQVTDKGTNKGAPVTVLHIPEDGLPDGMAITVRGDDVTVTLKTNIAGKKASGKTLDDYFAEVLGKFKPKKFTEALTALKKEVSSG